MACFYTFNIYFLVTNSFNIKSVVLLEIKLVVADSSYPIFGEIRFGLPLKYKIDTIGQPVVGLEI